MPKTGKGRIVKEQKEVSTMKKRIAKQSTALRIDNVPDIACEHAA